MKTDVWRHHFWFRCGTILDIEWKWDVLQSCKKSMISGENVLTEEVNTKRSVRFSYDEHRVNRNTIWLIRIRENSWIECECKSYLTPSIRMKFWSNKYSVHVLYESRLLFGEILSVTSSDESKTLLCIIIATHVNTLQDVIFRDPFMCKKTERKIYSILLSFRIFMTVDMWCHGKFMRYIDT